MPHNSSLRSRRAGVLIAAAAAAAGTMTSFTPAGAVTGDAAADGSYAYTARIVVGDALRGCTGTLVDHYWVLTAASCFSDDPAQPQTLAAGAPKWKTTVTVGAKSADVAELVPRQERDLVMARLATAVDGVTPPAFATTAPTSGETLRVAGYGRTKDEWAPLKPHTGSFTLGAVNATGISVTGTGGAAVCKGDTGAPTIRETGGKTELVAVASRSWQGGCLDTPATETRTGATATRIDDLGGWISSTVAAGGVSVKSDTKLTSGQSVVGADLKLTMRPDGDLVVTHRQVDNGILWESGTSGNNGAWAYVQPDGNLVVYKSDGNPAAGTGALWASGTWGQSGAFLKLRNDGNVAMVKADGSSTVWSAGTTRLDQKLNSDTKIKPGQWFQSQTAVVEMQADGNLVRYRRADAEPTWNTNTAGNKGAWAYVQTDGNFVLYKSDGNPAAGTGALWGSNTWGQNGAFLKLQDDGTFALYKKNAAETVANSVWSATTFRSGTQLVAGQQVYAKTTRLAMQWDGDLVLYRLSDNAVLWHSNTAGNGNAFLRIQPDGNAVVYTADGSRGLWASGTFWSTGAFLKLQDDGNLVVYKADGGEGIGGAIWSTNTFA
ncbi:trypsin-like serine protease [Kitasatospora sp. NPDC058048]|uniref:trypsin-like serine protease n=1 Tax=Kitasatospora sp. NPDC058048 TaxID=3346313 RepID=UPI0036D81F5B